MKKITQRERDERLREQRLEALEDALEWTWVAFTRGALVRPRAIDGWVFTAIPTIQVGELEQPLYSPVGFELRQAA